MTLSVEVCKILFEIHLNKMNDRFLKYYKKEFPDELAQKEFIPCCTEEQLELLAQAYIIYTSNNPNKNNNKSILRAITIFYYSTSILEYYVLEDADMPGGCFYKIKNKGINRIINQITYSEEAYASQLRRLLMGLQM